jgi:hypothetical protein
VEIRFGSHSQLGLHTARTDFVRSGLDGIRAEIYIDRQLRSIKDMVELIAHELEHVIEQLDEVELRPSNLHGVYLIAGDAFETVRAIHVGRKVSDEVSRATYTSSRLQSK